MGVTGTHRGGGVPEGVHGVIADVTDTDSIRAAFDQAEAVHGGPIGTVVVASGTTRDGLLMRMSDEDLRDVLEANLLGPMFVAREALRTMVRARSGSLVFVSSMSAKYGVAGQTNYVASKAGLEGFAKSLAREYAMRGIRVNVVAPGPTQTDMMNAVPEAALEQMISDVPMRRLGQPEEIAGVIYDVSRSSFMTGSIVAVGGGL